MRGTMRECLVDWWNQHRMVPRFIPPVSATEDRHHVRDLVALIVAGSMLKTHRNHHPVELDPFGNCGFCQGLRDHMQEEYLTVDAKGYVRAACHPVSPWRGLQAVAR